MHGRGADTMGLRRGAGSEQQFSLPEPLQMS